LGIESHPNTSFAAAVPEGKNGFSAIDQVFFRRSFGDSAKSPYLCAEIINKGKMKKLSLLACMALTIALCSCVSNKKIIYFQGADEMFQEDREITQRYEMHIKPADQLLIKVTCEDPTLLDVFSNDVLIGGGGGSRMTSSSMSSASGGMTNAYGYTVTNEGFVRLPGVGTVKVSGLTCEECAKAIEAQIVNVQKIKNPQVTVRLLNARVTVLGAAKAPKVVNLTSERNSVLDVLSQCADVADASLRQKVTLIREENGMRKKYDLDLTQADIFDSPAFYVQQNDMIYIQPNKAQNVRSSAFTTFLSAGASIISVISSIVALGIALTK